MSNLGARRGALALCALVLLLATGACGSSDEAEGLANRLQFEGYNNLTVSLQNDQPAGDVVVIRARGNSGLSDNESIDNLQNAVWNSLPLHFDALDIQVGAQQRTATYAQLTQRFGPRSSALDERPIGTKVSTIVIISVLAVGGLLVLAVMYLITMHRRRLWEEREQAQRLLLDPGPSAHRTPPPAFS